MISPNFCSVFLLEYINANRNVGVPKTLEILVIILGFLIACVFKTTLSTPDLNIFLTFPIDLIPPLQELGIKRF